MVSDLSFHKMASIRQKRALKETIENLKSKTPLTKGEILLKSGYSESVSKKPALVYDSDYFTKKLAKLDDGLVLDKTYEWATDDSDKRTAVQCQRMIYELKRRFPDQTTKVVGLFAKLRNLQDE